MLDGVEFGIVQLMLAVKGLYIRLNNESIVEDGDVEGNNNKLKGEKIEVSE